MPLPLDIRSWATNDQLRRELQEALENPALQKAFATLEEACLPSFGPQEGSVGGPVSLDMQAGCSARYLHRSGFYAYKRALYKLALTGDLPEKPEIPPPWGEFKPEVDGKIPISIPPLKVPKPPRKRI